MTFFIFHSLSSPHRSKACGEAPTRLFFRILFFIFFLSLMAFSLESATLHWQTLLPGFEEAGYQTLNAQNSPIHFQLYRIDPHKFSFQMAQARDFKIQKIGMKDLAIRTGALLAMNASFFDGAYRPLGLVVEGGKLLNPLRPISWWGIFSIDKNHTPKISRLKDFRLSPQIEMAVQTGPRLVEGGVPVQVKPNLSKKSFIAITADHKILLGVTHLGLIDAPDLTRLLAQELKVTHALNLDGGGSTQLYAKVGNYEKEITGFTEVVNGIVVVLKR